MVQDRHPKRDARLGGAFRELGGEPVLLLRRRRAIHGVEKEDAKRGPTNAPIEAPTVGLGGATIAGSSAPFAEVAEERLAARLDQLVVPDRCEDAPVAQEGALDLEKALPFELVRAFLDEISGVKEEVRR